MSNNFCPSKNSRVNLIQIINKGSKDSLTILTTCRIQALAYYVFTKLSMNKKMTPLQVKTIIEDFHSDARNSDLNLTVEELLDRLKLVDEDEDWQEMLHNVQLLYYKI
ncbi:hypothetical protein Zmor_023329 [Zophobas morio]|uniref:Uncharacterized protein n=1 Tax=Zophobas morio TaxID=2755281 RepID=A0AA38HWQ5_9CUCU|nr:hypothetical protein Zmor_023329 [Zophobas morio]